MRAAGIALAALLLVACGGQVSTPTAVAGSTPENIHATPIPALPPPRLVVIPKIGVSATVQAKGIDAKGVAEVPDDGAHVAWYRFTASPGEAGVGVYAAHRDTAAAGPAVFYKLDLLTVGDEIKITSQDGSVRSYRVTGTELVDSGSRIGSLMEGLARSIALYTCDGPFNAARGEYTQRRVVRAQAAT